MCLSALGELHAVRRLAPAGRSLTSTGRRRQQMESLGPSSASARYPSRRGANHGYSPSDQL